MRSQLVDKSTAELLGRLAVYEQALIEMAARLEEQSRQIDDLRRSVARAVSPSQMISEARAAELLGLSSQTLARWRKSARPPIPVLESEGVIRYRLADIETFIREGTRGGPKPKLT